jgi:hypothetical protein
MLRTAGTTWSVPEQQSSKATMFIPANSLLVEGGYRTCSASGGTTDRSTLTPTGEDCLNKGREFVQRKRWTDQVSTDKLGIEGGNRVAVRRKRSTVAMVKADGSRRGCDNTVKILKREVGHGPLFLGLRQEGLRLGRVLRICWIFNTLSWACGVFLRPS